MASQCRAGNEIIERQVDSMRRLHRPQQSLPKRSIPVPQINLLVDSIARNQLLSFLDAYSSYYQITMFEPDKEKTTFVIE